MADDGTVSIKIAGEVGSSLTASTTAAKSSLADLAVAGSAAAGALDGSLKESFLDSALAAGRMAGEVADLGDKLSSGDFAGAASEVATIAGRFSELGAAALGPVGAIAALAGGIGFVVYQSLEAQKANDDLAEGFALTGRGANMSAEAVGRDLGFLSQLPGSTAKAADGFTQLTAQHANWSAALANQVGQLLPAFIKTYGNDAPQAAGKLMAALTDLTVEGFQKLDRDLLGLNPAEFQQVENLIKVGDTAQATSRILADLSKNSGVYIKSLGDQIYDDMTEMKALQDGLKNGVPMFNGREFSVADARLELAKLSKDIDDIRAKEKQGDQTTKDNAYKGQLEAADAVNAKLDERKQILQQIAQFQGDAAHAHNPAHQKIFSNAAAAEQSKLTESDNKKSEETYRNYVESQDAMAAAAKSGSAARIAATENEANEAKKLFGDQSNEYLQAIAELNAAKRESSQQGAREQSAAAKQTFEEAATAARDSGRDIIAADQGTADQRRDAVKKLWNDLASGEHRTAAEIAEIHRELTAELAEIDKQATANSRAIERDDINTSAQIQKIGLGEKKAMLDQEVEAGEITEEQKIALQKEYAAQAAGIDIQVLQHAIDSGKLTVVEANADANKIKVIQARLGAELQQIDNQQTKSWQQMTSSIESAESSLVSDIFSKRQGLGKDLEQIGLQMLERQVEYYLKEYTERAMMNLRKLVSDKATTQQSDALALQSSIQQTALTQTQQAAQVGAVTAGVTAQNAAQSAGKAAGMAQSVAMGSAQIGNDAMVGASGAYSALASIPVVGPFLGAAAAAVTFAAIMGYDALTSAEGGQYSVPFDGQLTELHKDEMVLPASIAGPMRDTFEGRESALPQFGGGASLNVTHNIQSIDTGGIERVMRNNIAQIARVARNYQRNHVRR
jgi:hypothetical protein